MIDQARYRDGTRTAIVTLERVDTWIEDSESIVNFPGILEFDDRLVLSFARSQHGREHAADEETDRVIESYDDGETWQPAPDDYPLVFRDPQTGRIIDRFGVSIGYLGDGTIVHIGHNTQLQHDVGYAGRRMHDEFQQDDPTFRFQRASGDGQLLETIKFKVPGMPWGRASYQVYSPIIELDDGDLLAAMEWCKILPEGPVASRGPRPDLEVPLRRLHRALQRRRAHVGVRHPVRSRRGQAGLRHLRPVGRRWPRRSPHG